MEYTKIRKAVMLTSAAAVLAGGTVVLTKAYQSGNIYDPSGSEQEIQANQVVFSDDTGNNLNKDNKDKNSDLWEKDQNVQDKQPQGQNSTGYLYESGRSDLSQITLASGDGLQGLGTLPGANGNGTVYDIVSNGSGADLILPGGSIPGSGSGTGTGQSGNSNKDNGKNDSGKTDPTPSVRPSATAKDPEPSKSNPEIGSGGNGGFVTKAYDEKSVSSGNVTVCIRKPWDMDSDLLYKGQSVTARTLYYALETYVILDDAAHTQYVWREEDFEKYVRIDGISFDGGETFISDFPVTIPTDLEEGKMVIKVSYRFSTSSDKWIEQNVDYDPEDTKLYVLSDQIKEENATIDPDTIINSWTMYPEVGTKENLLRDQSDLLGADELDAVFPGWMEDGEMVPWFYEITAGRHILEPADMVPLDDKYKVSLNWYWMSDDYEVGFQYSNLCYLQTLTDYDDDTMLVRAAEDAGLLVKYGSEIEVPEYVQAIDFADDSETVIQYMHVPDTVLYINDTAGNLLVHKGWDVSEDNPKYASTEDGMLLNKEETEVLGIPTEVEKITIPETVTKVSLSAQNQIRELYLDVENMDEMPDIMYSNLKDCTIYVQDGLLEAFVRQNQEVLENGTELSVALESDPKTVYHVENDLLIDSNGMLCRALPGSTSRKIPADVKEIKSGAFADSTIETLILPDGVTDISLADRSFENGALNKIFCYTEEQYENMTAQEDRFGAENIEIELLSVSKEGIAYSRHTKDDVETVTLISAPETITSFEGKVTAQDGSPVVISEIGDNAFADCLDLEWVVLPEHIKKIGYQAFANCTSLQGLLIDSKDSITIGNKAVDGCTSLRFIASNAHEGIMEDGYAPVVSDNYGTKLEPNYYFYVPTEPDGYCSTALSFTPESEVDGYVLIDCGETGKVLYGFTEEENGEKNTWLALRSGGIVDAEVKLPTQTAQIFECAFADVVSRTGTYNVNWSELPLCSTLSNGAFRNSDLGEYVVLGDNYSIGNYTFATCKKLKEIVIPGDSNINIGESAFINCVNLEKVTFGSMWQFASLYNYLFAGCNKLTDIYLESETPCGLVLQGNFAFRFNSDWTEEEEQEHLTVHVPEGAEAAYVKAWRYGFSGYYDDTIRSAYIQMWNAVETELYYETFEIPSEEMIVAAMRERILSAENRIRALLRITSVEEATDFYPYRVDNDIYLTLLGAPSYVKELYLDQETLDLPYGATLDYIGTNAFAGSPNLTSVTIPGTLIGIEPDAFAGVEGELTLNFEGFGAPELEWDGENPFSFGVADENLKIRVPEGFEQEYLDAWTYRMAGYRDYQQLQSKVVGDLAGDDGETPDEEVVEAKMEEILLPVYNRLRLMMGLEEVEDLGDFLDRTWTDGSDTDPDPDPDWPDFPDWPDWPDTDPDWPEWPDDDEADSTDDVILPDDTEPATEPVDTDAEPEGTDESGKDESGREENNNEESASEDTVEQEDITE